MSKYYVEKKSFGKSLYRSIVEGTQEMLEAYPNLDPIVQIRSLDIDYGYGSKKFSAVKDLNLNIYQGEVLGLVGESGSGKSTIGRAIIGLTPHSFGHIQILDKIIPKDFNKGFKWSKNHKEIIDFMVNKVQMIFQDPTNSLNPFQNVENVVGEGLKNTKNSRHILLATFDKETFKTLVLEMKKIGYKNFYPNWLHEYNQHEHSIQSSYDFVFQKVYNQIKKEAKDAKKLFGPILFWMEKQKKQRDELNQLSEKQAKRTLIIDILKQVGLDETVLSRFPLEFSGGQQQRLGICRSVILQPKLLIADEPISALDVSIQAQVINIFNDLKEKYNLTILFIAHDLRMVEYISDRIAVINKGVLLEIGPTNEIVNNPCHPYTKSLLDAVPSITGEKGSLIGYVYDSQMCDYDENNQPKWQHLGNNHFVLATDQELVSFQKIKTKKQQNISNTKKSVKK